MTIHDLLWLFTTIHNISRHFTTHPPVVCATLCLLLLLLCDAEGAYLEGPGRCAHVQLVQGTSVRLLLDAIQLKGFLRAVCVVSKVTAATWKVIIYTYIGGEIRNIMYSFQITHIKTTMHSYS